MAITKTGKIAIVVGVVAVGLTILGLYIRKQYRLLYDSCWAITGAIIRKLSLDNVEITILLKLMNRSDLTIEVSNQEYQIFVNEMYVATVKKTEGFTWVTKTTKTLFLDVVFNPQELLKTGIQNIVALLGDKTKFRITIKGLITAKSGIVSVRDLMFETTYTLAELLAPTPEILECKNFK